jgi:hypothetical protein
MFPDVFDRLRLGLVFEQQARSRPLLTVQHEVHQVFAKGAGGAELDRTKAITPREHWRILLSRRPSIRAFHKTTVACPLGHATHTQVFIDPGPPQHEQVWAAAGTWHDVFGIEPHRLVEVSGGTVIDLQHS